MNVRVLPTIAIHSTKHPSGHVLINADTYDPKIHKAYYDPAGNPTAPPDGATPSAPTPAPLADVPAATGEGVTAEAVTPAALPAAEAIAMIKEAADVGTLAEWEVAEQAGKGRSTVLAALGKRIAEIGG